MALLEALYPLIEMARFNRRYDDDFIDRLNNRYSTFIFIVISIIVTTFQNVLEPISCWAPAQFPPWWMDYTNKICWVSNTYYVPMDKLLPAPNEPREQQIAYYQWVPFVIFIQALFFFAPNVVWKMFNSQSGIHVNKIVSLVGGAEHESADARDKTIRSIARNLDRALRSQREYRTGRFATCRQTVAKHCCIFCGKRYGNYLVTLYLLVKLLYVGNGVGQLFLLNAFLGNDYHMYGIQIVKEIMSSKSLESSKRFPRVTMCDFDIRALGNHKQTYTVQCALPINLLNEKVYTFIWFWLVFVSLFTALNLVLWLWTLFGRNRTQYVKKYLKIITLNLDKTGKVPSTPSKDFSEDYLRQDGIFILRLIAKNTNDLVVAEIIQKMWENYKRHCELKLINDV